MDQESKDFCFYLHFSQISSQYKYSGLYVKSTFDDKFMLFTQIHLTENLFVVLTLEQCWLKVWTNCI